MKDEEILRLYRERSETALTKPSGSTAPCAAPSPEISCGTGRTPKNV